MGNYLAPKEKDTKKEFEKQRILEEIDRREKIIEYFKKLKQEERKIKKDIDYD